MSLFAGGLLGELKTALAGVFATLAGKSGGQTIVGGTGVTDKLVLQGTSGNGTSTAAALEMKVGNNGALTAVSVLNNGELKCKILKADNGSESEPSYAFNYYPLYGIYFNPASGIVVSHAGTSVVGTRTEGIVFPSNKSFAWASSSISSPIDLSFYRDSSATVAQRDGTNPQTHRIYNTYTNSSNYERIAFTWNSNIAEIKTEAAGTGTLRALRLVSNGTITTPDVIEFSTSGGGIILKSPDGTRYRLTVANGGTLSISAA